MSVAMAIGGYAAGSTPMGGGTVGFPILVLLFDQPAQLGRDFSFAVQSIGMTRASIFILARRQPLAWAMLKGSMLGALFGVPLGIFFIAPLVPALWIEIIFADIWGSFGLLHLWRIREIASHQGIGIGVALLAGTLCLLGFEKLRAWGAILVGELQQRKVSHPAKEPIESTSEV